MLLLSWRGEQYYEKKNMHMERANLSATCIVGFKLLFYLNKNKTENVIEISTFKVNFVMPEHC